MNIIKERLEEAIASKRGDIKSYIWKGAKREVNGETVQDEIRLYDATPEQLKKFYGHCVSMLYNNDKKNPGRYVLIDIIKDQIERCNCELFLRWIEQDKGKPRFNFLSDIRTVLDNNKDVISDIKALKISEIVGGCPEEYKNLSVSMVMDGLLDRLGRFSKDHITLTFITKQGLWFTQQELKDLTEKDAEGNTRDRLDVIRERLGLRPTVNIYITPKGLSYTQLRAMIMLKSKKYSELTTDQLKTLRNIILFALIDEAQFHAEQWETRKKQIEEICQAREIDMTDWNAKTLC